MSADDQLIRLTLRGDSDLLEAAGAELFDAGAGGLVEEPGALSVYAQGPEELSRFRQVAGRFSRLTLSTETVDGDWQTTWQSALAPERVCPSFTLRPTHCPKDGSEDQEPDEETLWFKPEVSFGEGGHPTTRLAATWVEEQCRARPGLHLFDVGTGTGVLALVALKSGADSVVAVDNDPVAVSSAKHNAELNHLENRLTLALGSADFSDETFPVVLANLNTPILRDLHEQLAERVADGGLLMLTGLLTEDIDELSTLFSEKALTLKETRTEGEWALVVWAR